MIAPIPDRSFRGAGAKRSQAGRRLSRDPAFHREDPSEHRRGNGGGDAGSTTVELPLARAGRRGPPAFRISAAQMNVSSEVSGALVGSTLVM